MSKIISCLLAGLCLSPLYARAQAAATPVPNIDVNALRDDRNTTPPAINRSTVTQTTIANFTPRTNDTAKTLENTPGISLYGAGAVSSLPVIHGLNDDRNAIVLGGVPIASACANHMNPPLSYIDPAAVGQIEVLTLNVPVSKGGDSIGGSILVKPRAPVFLDPTHLPTKGGLLQQALGDAVLASGSVSSFFRSNGGGVGVNGHIDVASKHWALQYDGAWAKTGDYSAGGNAGLARSTNYMGQNQSATLTYQNEGQTLAFHYAFQSIPYQGFPNQWMDMTGNNANTYDLSYTGQFGWGVFEANSYYHITQHDMNFLADKNGGVNATPQGGMPMYVNDQNYGYSLKATIFGGEHDLYRVGNSLAMETLNEWWPPVGMNGKYMPGMMCCQTFINMNNGQRNVLGTFAEWEHNFGNGFSSLLGLRNDTVWTNAGDVQGYSAMYAAQAAAFNTQDHAKNFVDWDVTALLRYNPDALSQYEFGYTRKERAPNLYELYAWSTNGMAARMIGWFGDGNGYVGNLNLRPETANTVSISGQWSDPTGKLWNVKLSPYYSYVQDFIDVDYKGTIGVANALGKAGVVNLLQFSNHDAELYGFDLSGQALLAQTANYGDFTVTGIVGYVRGWRVQDGMSLYHMAPLNAKIALQNGVALWGGQLTSAVELQASAAKTEVETVRLEPTTPAYAVVNLRTSWAIQNMRFDLGVENVANVLYDNPLGGIDIANWKSGFSQNLHNPVASAGRNIYGGMTIKF